VIPTAAPPDPVLQNRYDPVFPGPVPNVTTVSIPTPSANRFCDLGSRKWLFVRDHGIIGKWIASIIQIQPSKTSGPNAREIQACKWTS
jgi:hypothetical protein